jgi:hypothetical protein
MAGVFKMIAVEEQNIRTNISSRTSPLLQSVFLQCKTKVIRFYYQNKRKCQQNIHILIHCKDKRNHYRSEETNLL